MLTQRRKLLQYLRRARFDAYAVLISRLGLKDAYGSQDRFSARYKVRQGRVAACVQAYVEGWRAAPLLFKAPLAIATAALPPATPAGAAAVLSPGRRMHVLLALPAGGRPHAAHWQLVRQTWYGGLRCRRDAQTLSVRG